MQERPARPSRAMQAFRRSTICMLDDGWAHLRQDPTRIFRLSCEWHQHIPRLKKRGLQSSQTHEFEYLVHDEKKCFAVDCGKNIRKNITIIVIRMRFSVGGGRVDVVRTGQIRRSLLLLRVGRLGYDERQLRHVRGMVSGYLRGTVSGYTVAGIRFN